MLLSQNELIFHNCPEKNMIYLPKNNLLDYFHLMKGMEGHADKNEDNKISSGELNSYIQENVLKQTSGSQKPDLVGNFNKILIDFN